MIKRCAFTKKVVSIILSMCIVANSSLLNVCATELPQNDDETTSSIIDSTSGIATNSKSIEEIIGQYKFRARQGHGFAAERGNDLIDKIKGKNTVIVGDNNVANGADRMIINRDGSTLLIQTKYHATASSSINDCFDDVTGLFRYLDGDGNPMQIEVPKDQYEQVVNLMRAKIEAKKVPGITDPNEAENLVRKGNITYKAAQNLAKAGTIESLTYDAATGVVSSTCAAGISVVLNYAACRLNGYDRDKAVKLAAEEGLYTGVLIFGTHIVASQLSKTALKDAFKTSSEELVKACGKNFAEAIVNSMGKSAAKAGTEAAAKGSVEAAAKALRIEGIFSVVALVFFTIPDALDLFSGKISRTQFVKNFAVTAASIAGGVAGGAGGAVIGELIVPGAGAAVGKVVGTFVGGFAAGIVTDIVADSIVDDDATAMYDYIQTGFAQKCEDYLISEKEAENIVNELANKLDDKLFKEMYKCDESRRIQFVDDLLEPLFEQEVAKRQPLPELTEEELRFQLKQKLSGVALIH